MYNTHNIYIYIYYVCCTCNVVYIQYKSIIALIITLYVMLINISLETIADTTRYFEM